LREKYLIWDAFVAGSRRVDVHPLVLSERLHEQAIAAAEAAALAIRAVGDRAHADSVEAARYGYPPDVMRLVRACADAGDRTSFVRVDLLLGEDGLFRACEINADSPGGHNEAFGLPRLAEAAGFAGGRNPTTMVEELALCLAARARDSNGRQGAVGIIFSTAWSEDLQICALLRRALTRLGVPVVFAPPTAPRLGDECLTLDGVPVRALYRYFPTEYMEGQNNVVDLASAVARRLVRTVPSFADMYLQSKLAFARAWALRDGLDPAHRSTIETHLPLTFDVAEIDREELLAHRDDWVLKRALGRVGDQVFVGPMTPETYWRGLIEEIHALDAPGMPDGTREAWVAQRFVRQRPIPTPWGDRLVTLGAYLLEGRFVGYFARVTPKSHVSHEALCVPVFIAADESARAHDGPHFLPVERKSPPSRSAPPIRSSVLAMAPVAMLSMGCMMRTPATALDAQGVPTADLRVMAVPAKADAIAAWQLPPTASWSPYEKLTLLTCLADTTAIANVPDVTQFQVVRHASAAATRLAEAGVPAGTLWVVDSQGAASVVFGATLSQLSARPIAPVLTFNNWPADKEVVPAEQTLSALLTI
jgi:glutathionylspermidine synthase